MSGPVAHFVDDDALLRAFCETGDQQAFSELVTRYIGVVYASARRQVNDPHLAEDVTQAVFILLARKSRSLVGMKALGGWLVSAARLCARSAFRAETRHRAREQKASTMRSESTSNSQTTDDGLDEMLDEALGALSMDDRTVITLRYLQDQPLKEVASRMAISEAAATKRVSRATARMRQFFAQRGVEMTPFALGEALVRRSVVQTPAHVATAAARAAVDTSQTAASLIADGAGAGGHTMLIVAVAGFVVLLVILAFFFQNRSAAPSASNAAATTAQSAPSIRVGFYLSHKSAVENDPGTGQPTGYGMLTMKELTDPAFDVIPVIEPDTATLGELPGVLKEYFPNKEPLNAASAKDLETLDVIIAGAMFVPADVLNALEEVVENGTGLMTRNRFVLMDPQYTPQVKKLFGLTDAAYGYAGPAMECEVMDEHPILSSRTGAKGAAVQMRVNGVFGVLGPQSKGLIRLKDVSPINTWDRDHLLKDGKPAKDGVEFYTVYTHELGKGRVVCCCYATFDRTNNISDAVGPEFMKRSIKWLAKRPVG